jgi:uncharacterized membrane protein
MDISPQKAITIYLVTVPVFFVIDLIWLGLVAKVFYQRHLGYLLRPQVNWSAAIVFYMVFIVGILFFAVFPALEARSAMQAVSYGALFGFFTYATYDLTNQATVKGWPVVITLVDLAWGTAFCSLVSWISYSISTQLS